MNSPGTGSAISRSAPLPSSPHSSAPFSLVLGIAAGIAVYTVSLGPLRDIDLYWHLLAGSELAAGIPPSALGTTWSYAPDPLPWTSSAWLFELLMFRVHEGWGWEGIAALRVLTAAISVAVLAWTTLTGRPRALAGFPYLLAVVVVTHVSQERPQQVTIIGACALGGVLAAGLNASKLPAWWVVAPATAVWANLHGGWILAPFVLILIALSSLLATGTRSARARSALALAAVSLGAGCLTPSGINGLAAPLRLSEAGVRLAEWQAMQPTKHLGVTSIAMLALFLIGWSASNEVPRGEGAVVLIILVFMWMAWRNLALGLALLAPVAAHRLTLAFPTLGRRPEPPWSAPSGVVVAVLLTVAGIVSVFAKPNLPLDEQPIGLASAIAELPSGQRVLNDYNSAGIVLYFGGRRTQTAVDGRADRYSPQYQKDYSALVDLRGDWRRVLDSLRPTSALLSRDAALARVLQEEMGWEVLGADGGWVLLAPAADRRP